MAKYLIFASLAILLQGAFANWCGLESCTGEHIDCTMANGDFGENCPDSAVMLNLANAQDSILKTLNTFRNDVAGGTVGELEPADRMGKLRWNVSLANLCRKNVKQCTVPPGDYGYDECRNTPDFDFVGQNQAYALIGKGETHNNLEVIQDLLKTMNSQCDTATAADMAQFPGTTGANGESIGACAQNVRSYATRVGCAALVWFNPDESKMLKLCCNYDMANILDWPIYDAGAAGSKCAAKDTEYPNLCAASEKYNINEFWTDYE